MTFLEKKAAIKKAASESNRKTFNESEFDELVTSLLNDPEYTVKVATTVKGEHCEKEIKPAVALRKAIIGGIMKEAGHDTAEQQKFIDEYQFGKLPVYPVFCEAIEGYLDAGKSFAFQPKTDMRAVLTLASKEELVKEVKAPTTGKTTRKRYGAYRQIKSRSTCPNNLRVTVE